MPLRHRLPALLAIAFTLILVQGLFAQPVIGLKSRRTTQPEAQLLDAHFRSYQLATLDTRAVAGMLRTQQAFDEIRLETGDKTFRFDLRARDLRAPHYKLRVQTDQGVSEMPRSPNQTYAGYTLKGHYDVRVTSADEYFSALIGTVDGDLYIEPARRYLPGAPWNELVVYRAIDAIRQFGHEQCGVDGHQHQHFIPNDAVPDTDPADARRACKVVQVALANDHLMFNSYGSVGAVESHNMTVLNNVATNYDNEFADDLEMTVVEIFVPTNAGNDPFTPSNNAGDLLDDFTDWGPTGFDNTHDVSSLWTDRDFTGDVIGLAWVGTVCTNFKYNVLQDFSNNGNLLRVLQAHEFGHNFNASHDAPGSNTIMAPSVNNTNTWSNQSINQINNYINSVFCLGPCQAPQPPVAAFDADPTDGCAPLTVFFDDQSLNNPTSWNWTFPGGTPGTSTQQNPTVVYSNPGSFNVSLTVTNTQGSNSVTINNFIQVGENPFADFDFFIDENTVDFTNLSQFANSYLWNFGDGTTSTEVNPLHVYEEDGFYTVTLTATNDCGTDTYSQTIEIITLPVAFFDSDIVSGCEPFEVQFFNLCSPNTEFFSWSFPGGIPATSSEFEPLVLYQTPGVYNVTLTAFNEAGEDTYTATGYITVLAEPSADFTYTTDGLEVSFNSSNSTGDTFFWNFGDGTVSSEENPVYTYAVSGTYLVTLTVTNDCGSNAVQQEVSVLGLPSAGISSDTEYGCAPLVVQFQSISGGNPTSYAWVFQGGVPGTSNAANPVVTYSTPGLYDVQLTVTNNIGSDVLVLSDYIEVEFPTVSDFSFSQNGAHVAFFDESAHATSWSWSFGDGDTSTEQNPQHTFPEDGVYTVTLIASGICGDDTSTAVINIQTPATAGFTFEASGDCVPVSVQFFNQSSSNTTSVQWSFPGGSPSSSTQQNPIVTYNNAGVYNVRLIAFAPAGSDTLLWEELIETGAAPNASFLFVTNNLDITLTNQSTGAESFLWLFGDGVTSTDPNPSHTYSSFGTYLLTLIAYNDCGPDTSVVELVLGDVPNAFFTYSAHNGCAPFEIQFLDQSQNNPTAWSWTFDGGFPPISNEQNPVVSYAQPGSYTVALQVTNAAGTDVLVLEDLIQVASVPDATFLYEQQDNIVLLEYQGIDYDSLHWDFGDGRSDNSLNPVAVYAQSGTYPITLTVYNACGLDTAVVWVTINITSTNDPGLNPDHWTLAPNPFASQLALQGTPQTDGQMQIELYDLHGRLFHVTDWNYTAGPVRRELVTDLVPTGMVLVVLRQETGTTVLRAMKIE